MGLIRTDNLNYHDVKSATHKILKSGVPLDQITLHLIREETGDRNSSPSVISKHIVRIKAEVKRSAAIGATKVTKADMSALRALIFNVVERAASLNPEEKVGVAHSMADFKQEYDSVLEMKDEIISDLEHQVFGLEGECGMNMIEIGRLHFQIAKYEGRQEALSMMFGLVLASMPALADRILIDQSLTAEQQSILEIFRASRLGRISTPQEAEDAFAAGGYPHRVS